MHPVIYREFERICSQRSWRGAAVLDVGAVLSERGLLRMKAIDGAAERIGVNLAGPCDDGHLRILQANANRMDCFEDGRFDLVVCNGMLEHDKYFWKTAAEIRRVLKPGGMAVACAAGYRYYGFEQFKRLLWKTPLIRRLLRRPYLNVFFTGTFTYEIHAAPGDYYRFSPQAFREVVFEGMTDVVVSSLMLPPRIIGHGFKPAR